MCTDNDDVGEVAVMGFDGTLIATVWQGMVPDITAKCSARRIVAAVNACAGIRTEALERRAHLLKAYDDDLATVIKQRDKLLAVCDELSACAEYWSEYDVPIGIVARLDAVIAEAKGQPRHRAGSAG